MANLWGATSYLYSSKLYRVGILDFDEFFQRSDIAVSFFKLSRNMSLIFPTFMSITFFALLMALSFKFQRSKNKNNSQIIGIKKSLSTLNYSKSTELQWIQTSWSSPKICHNLNTLVCEQNTQWSQEREGCPSQPLLLHQEPYQPNYWDQQDHKINYQPHQE